MPKKPVPYQHPIRIEEDYYKALKRFVDFMWELTETDLIPKLPDISDRAESIKPDHMDVSAAGETAKIIGAMRVAYYKVVTAKVRSDVSRKYGNATNTFNKAQNTKVFRSVLGFDLFIPSPWLKDAMADFVYQNVNLIKSISEDYFTQIEGIVQRGFQAGLRHEEIAEQLLKRYDITKNRAALIARDQVSKFNGQLTQLRQTQAGVTEYIWQTAGDNRVRPEHAARDGETFKWSDPPPDGHPSIPIGCRCFASPKIPDSLYRS